MAVSLSAIVNALHNYKGRLKSIKKISFDNNDIDRSIYTSDKYGVTFVAKVDGVASMIKLFYDDTDFIFKVKQSMALATSMQLPYMYNYREFPAELMVVAADNGVKHCTMFVAPLCGNNIIKTLNDTDDTQSRLSLVKQLASMTHCLISLHVIPDRFAVSGLYVTDGALKFSLSETFTLTQSQSNVMLAFGRYMIWEMMLLSQDIIRSDEKDSLLDTSLFEFDNNAARFDCALAEYFLSADFDSKLFELATKAVCNKAIYLKAIEIHSIADMMPFLLELADTFELTELPQNYSRYLRENDYKVIGEPAEDRQAVLRVSDGKCGYINFSGELKIDFIYDKTNDFREGIAVCEISASSGAIDRDGNILLPFEYKKLRWESVENQFYITTKDGKRSKIKRTELFNNSTK